jgi:hypothetical protein
MVMIERAAAIGRLVPTAMDRARFCAKCAETPPPKSGAVELRDVPKLRNLDPQYAIRCVSPFQRGHRRAALVSVIGVALSQVMALAARASRLTAGARVLDLESVATRPEAVR